MLCHCVFQLWPAFTMMFVMWESLCQGLAMLWPAFNSSFLDTDSLLLYLDLGAIHGLYSVYIGII